MPSDPITKGVTRGAAVFGFLKAWNQHRKQKRAERKAAKRGETISQPEEDKAMMQALKSKTVWFGILTSVWGAAQVFLAAGDFSKEAVVSLVSGVVIIVLRAVTTQPLSAK